MLNKVNNCLKQRILQLKAKKRKKIKLGDCSNRIT